MKFKYNLFAIAAIATALVGCNNPPEYQTALYNYSKEMCKGKLKSVQTWHTIKQSGYTCITDSGVEYITVQLEDIPVQYWEIPDEPSKYKRKDKEDK